MVTITRLFKQKLSLPLMLVLATTACSQAVSSTVVAPSASATAATATSASSDYQLQILKNCEFVKQRALSKEEIALYQKLKNAEKNMAALQAPLDLMEQQLETQTKFMESMSAQIEQQVASGDPDPLLLETQAELGQEISAIVDSFEPELAAVSKHGEEIGAIADEFTALLAKDAPDGSYDQIRIIAPGEQAAKDCNNGMFFQKSFTVKSLQAMKSTD
jgi:hypothetical protein